MARAAKKSDPEAVRRALLGLRPAILDLFAGYGIPNEAGSTMLREAVQLQVIRCERIDDPRHFFLEMLEESCRAYVEAQAAEEGKDDDTPRA